MFVTRLVFQSLENVGQKIFSETEFPGRYKKGKKIKTNNVKRVQVVRLFFEGLGKKL